MRHQAQKGFRGILVGIPQHQKGYLVYVPITRKIISSYDAVLDESFSSGLAYMSQPCAEAMAVNSYVSYTPYATSLKGKTGNIITFTQFEDGDLLSENRDNAESGDKSDDNSIMPLLISEEEMGEIDSGDESEDEPISTDMLEDIHDVSKSHPILNRIEACYKICNYIKRIKTEWKGALLFTKIMGKGLHKVFKAVVTYISQALPILG